MHRYPNVVVKATLTMVNKMRDDCSTMRLEFCSFPLWVRSVHRRPNMLHYVGNRGNIRDPIFPSICSIVKQSNPSDPNVPTTRKKRPLRLLVEKHGVSYPTILIFP